ncbi:plasma-membrane proton-efflux P-type ATPase [Acidocella aminolytica]|jgi:H+-transporting ATPase|uniref:Cation transporter ATPase n=1 Tax=Acidocella aminolytica 101 = DSM 11237 TaxID=1120923 RepID=A0A0D6PJX6_9PROT|nr:plasma-membrane proton-efflux P-type ATPase [Acidocella aminolytica]GAN81508.1 cation transporter ATPase [Acidocella aminolytica 101 = DSM 11237]GBQ34020.1 cation transport ATPase [Acidocella aminolytica 101 = DSM 11237]SHF02592.1 H+-transporting ATPase [Acidocella aminolytica 101 = DSM 11237]
MGTETDQPGVKKGKAPPGKPQNEFENLSPEETLARLQVSADGLSAEEAAKRLAQTGPNALAETHVSAWQRMLGYFWGPIPWMIEAAGVLSAVNEDWRSFAVIVAMLLINGGIGFWQEASAADALDALKRQLALKARVKRGGNWTEIDAADLVPGDIVRLRLGDVVPADVKLLEGGYLSIDQSALTGESLPVTRKPGGVAYSSTVVKEGEMVAAIYATGGNTFFGRTAKLVQSAGAVSHFQKAVLHIGNLLIICAVGLSALLIGVELERGLPVLTLLSFVLIVVVASIPVALPAVLSVTMALGALALSRMKAIVSRLESIEEMAGITVLCSDKTGTLTQNKLTLGTPLTLGNEPADEVTLAAALACKRENHDDAIDLAVLEGVRDKDALGRYEQRAFTPFDPTHKRTEATVAWDGKEFRVTKGAPQVIMALCALDNAQQAQAAKIVEEEAAKGYRTLGVARADEGANWRFLGILPLFDPPRVDSRETIEAARAHGIEVKMVTGDNTAIAREISGQLGLGTNILPASTVLKDGAELGGLVEQADGFAEVFPEHKYAIVKALQDEGHIVAMTGDGVNDAPALKQAEVGIAVSGATDAARSAASLILTAPGLSVIISAVEEARRIFERMMSYTIYRIAMTLSIMVFVVATMLIWNLYPLTTIMIILLALLDDIPIMTIAWDNAELPSKPVRWEMNRLLAISSVLGVLALAQSFGLYLLARDWLHASVTEGQTMMFLRFIVGGHLLLFSTRTRHPFWARPYPSWQLFSAIIATQIVGVMFVGFGWLMTPISWGQIGLIWLYDLVWFVLMDFAKLGTYRLMENRGRHQLAFISVLNKVLHPHGGFNIRRHGGGTGGRARRG